jgi:hypothetical protein
MENFIRTQQKNLEHYLDHYYWFKNTFLRSELINQFHFPKFRKHKGVETECTVFNLLVFLHIREQQAVCCGYSHSTAEEEHKLMSHLHQQMNFKLKNIIYTLFHNMSCHHVQQTFCCHACNITISCKTAYVLHAYHYRHDFSRHISQSTLLNVFKLSGCDLMV